MDADQRSGGDLIVHRAQALAAHLCAAHLRLVTAESCTAGGVAYALTTVSGASHWFERGFVTYTNESKRQMLGVSPVYLRDEGAVSEPVARAMALGALAHSTADVAIAVTGVAGPGGGSAQTPVGTVCFAWAGRQPVIAGQLATPWVRTSTVVFEGDRAAVRAQAIVRAMDGLLEALPSAVGGGHASA